MPYIRRRTKRKKDWRWIPCAAVVVAPLLVWWVLASNGVKPPLEVTRSVHSVDVPVRPAVLDSSRPNYRYSVIRGGAYSTQELTFARLRDPIVDGHYSDFERSKVRFVHAASQRSVYVSYRLNDKIYWTRRPVHLAQAEMLITDGLHEARARCGNRISETPREPIAPEEPPMATLDDLEPPPVEWTAMADAPLILPEVFPTPTPVELAVAEPVVVPLVEPLPRPYPIRPSVPGVIPWDDRPPIPPRPPYYPPTYPTPEPSTAILLAGALAAMIIRMRRR